MLPKKNTEKLSVWIVVLSVIFVLTASFGIPAFGAGNVIEQSLGKTRTSTGEVVVDLTPQKYEKGRLTFEIVLTTHTVNDLHKYNLMSIATLEYGGKRVYPASAPKLGGHHPAGRLVFEAEDLQGGFTVRIDGLHLQEVREFTWP